MNESIGCLGILGFALALAGGCSQGAENGGFPGYPQGPQGPARARAPATSGGSATFGVDAGDDGPNSCCVANGTPGCDDEFVEACVCADAVECCGTEWTGDCARLVDQLGCGQCMGNESAEGDPDDSGAPMGQDCCGGGPEPGCNDPVVEACVCAEIDFCCQTGWEKVCGSAVEALGCGHCGGEGDTGGDPPPPPPGGSTGEEPPPPPPPGMGDCCEAQMAPGCGDAGIQACVCGMDSFCCDDTWDQLCVDQVDSFGCGMCGGAPPPPPPPGTSACCEAQAMPGCGDPAIEACVCAIDDYCCTGEWDSVCAIFVTLFLCDSC